MEIVYCYKKKVRELGQPCEFEDSAPIVLVNIKPEEKIRTLNYIVLDPCHVGVQATPELGEHSVNTMTKNYSSSGMIHTEGGWPKDVNTNDVDAKKRHQKKIEKDESYIKSTTALAMDMIQTLSINTALNVYENYFIGEEDETEPQHDTGDQSATGKPSATVLTILKDPSEHKRIAKQIAWSPTDPRKLAVAYSIPRSQTILDTTTTSSYLWDIKNPNTPEMALTAPSPLCCIEFNPKDATCLIGGARNGSLYVFDTRRGSNPVEFTPNEVSHKDPVSAVRWIQSKQSTECVSISTDAQILFWDTRNMAEPLERNTLEILQSKVFHPQKFGSLCMDYDTTYSTSKLLIGADKGHCLIWNKKARKGGKEKVERIFVGHHSSVFAVQRCPFNPKYFLSIGDWTARIYQDDIWKTPILETRYNDSYLTDGCWSSTRPGVFFTTATDGTFSVWDLLHSHSKPAVSVHMTSGLQCVRSSNGKYVAVGDDQGGVSYIELSDDLSGYFNGQPRISTEEKNIINDILERETRREKVLEQKDKPAEQVQRSEDDSFGRYEAPSDDALNKYFEEELMALMQSSSSSGSQK